MYNEVVRALEILRDNNDITFKQFFAGSEFKSLADSDREKIRSYFISEDLVEEVGSWGLDTSFKLSRKGLAFYNKIKRYESLDKLLNYFYQDKINVDIKEVFRKIGIEFAQTLVDKLLKDGYIKIWGEAKGYKGYTITPTGAEWISETGGYTEWLSLVIEEGAAGYSESKPDTNTFIDNEEEVSFDVRKVRLYENAVRKLKELIESTITHPNQHYQLIIDRAKDIIALYEMEYVSTFERRTKFGNAFEPDTNRTGAKDPMMKAIEAISVAIHFFETKRDYEMHISIKDQPKERQNEKPKTNNEDEIFIVHGHSEEIKIKVCQVVEKLGLKPIVLNEQPNAGMTVIEKFEKNANVGFAIILMTGDDEGISLFDKGKDKSPRLRARQNVVLELGYFIARLSRARVITLMSLEVEIPSDFQGIVYTPLDSGGVWKFDLVRELKNAGYEVDANRLL